MDKKIDRCRCSKVHFVHCADIHIGTDRFGEGVTERDFTDSFNHVVEFAIQQKVDFFLIAGDLFNKSRITPLHLSDAEEGLGILKRHGIPVIAIEGNHDNSPSYIERESWLSYLSTKQYLKLLKIRFNGQIPILKPWDDVDSIGAYVDINGIRIYGAGYLGATTGRRLELIKPYIEKDRFNIFILHSGLTGVLPEFGGATKEEIEVVKDVIDYMALGHIHQRYVLENWIFNPGSLENWRIEEAGYKEKGFFHVVIDPITGRIEPHFYQSKRRETHLKTILLPNFNAPKQATEYILNEIESWEIGKSSIIQLTLIGYVQFSPFVIEIEEIKDILYKRFSPIMVNVVNKLNESLPGVSSSRDKGSISREQIEKEEIKRIIQERGKFPGFEEQITEIVLRVKKMALAKEDNETILDVIHSFVP
ncbi:MAG: metallophosphoesterase [bacterium]|nr:metallophosphoesterase [bacterium]